MPRPSLRAKRKRTVLAAMALTVGVLAVVMAGEGGRHFLMPAQLSSHHAGLTDCSTCHAGAGSGQVDLLHRLVTTVEPRQNSNLCVTCHAMGTKPFAPHTHPVEDLKRLTETLRRESKNGPSESLVQRIAFSAAARSPAADVEISCATCHKEHQGVFANLKTVSNQRCQTCHVSRFDSFGGSHPQFAKFPYQRRPRIMFDHQSHMTKYFPEAAKAAIAGQVAPDNCADCHQPGVGQKYMEVKPFATTCSGCHNGDVTGATQVSGPKGIDVIAVPGLDLATLGERGIDIGGWPKKSEAVLTPFMRLLLQSKGENVVSAVAGLDLLDLSKASNQDLARVAALAWAVKRLFNRLETTNPAAARVLTGDKSENQVNRLQMASLTGGMSHDVIAAGNHEWFPDLQDDLQRHDRREPTRDFKPPVKTTANRAKPLPPSGGGNAIAATKTPGADIVAPGGNTGGNKDDILSPGKKDDALTANKKDDILAPNNKDDILSGDKPAADNILSGGGDDSPTPKRGETNTRAGARKSADATPTPFDPEVWAQTGGWYRGDFAVRYHPTGHADQFVQTWLDFAGRAYGTSLHDQLTPIFDELAPKDAVGRCTKCHSVDDEAGAKIVNWQPFNANAINNRFTNYSHKPHIELIGTKTCVKCHELQQTESGFLKTYEGGDLVNYTPNFKHLDKAVCAACHGQQTAWENCTRCHGYHVPDVNSSSPVPAVPVAFDKPAASAVGTALPSDPDAGAPHDYATAEAAGTKQAWDDFIADHPSGSYHDLAVEQIAKLSPAASDKSDTTPGSSTPVTPEKPATVTPGSFPPTTPDNSTSPASGELTSADTDGLFRRGMQRAVGGDFKLAIQDFNEVIRRDPKHAGALNDRCWALAMLDEVQAALKDCNASLRALPNFPDALDSRGLVNLKLGFYKEAIADYTSALLYDSKRASALYGRGIAKRRSGRAAGAKADIDAAKTLQPTIVDEFASYGIQ